MITQQIPERMGQFLMDYSDDPIFEDYNIVGDKRFNVVRPDENPYHPLYNIVGDPVYRVNAGNAFFNGFGTSTY